MRTIEFDLISTLLMSMVVLFLGRFLVTWVPVLRRFNIPAPVVGGGVVALLLALVDGLLGVKLGFNLALKDTLLLMFFTTVGLAADARMLVKGGPRLLLFLGISVVLIAVQNTIGLTATRLLDLHPVVGLLGGSITLVGGHGTGRRVRGTARGDHEPAGSDGAHHGLRDRGPGDRRRSGRPAGGVPPEALQADRADAGRRGGRVGGAGRGSGRHRSPRAP